MKNYQPKTLRELIDSLTDLEKTYGPETEINVIYVQDLNQTVYPYEINGISVYGTNKTGFNISIVI